MSWLSDNLANILVIMSMSGLLILCIWSLIDDRKKGRTCAGCSHNCSTCALAALHGKKIPKNI
ncbi:MAG: hypothetical protein IJI92_02090 [Erysipelotrichaceae bacterium]|nr:hypothetical protein [Erysipelotrichaceae bacterium]